MEGGGTGSVVLPLKKNNIESVLTQLQTKWVSKRFRKTPSVIVRNFSVLRGTDGAMICARRRIRGGKDDTPARMVAAFTSGYVFQTLIRNGFSPSAPDAIAVGLVLAICQGLLHELQVQAQAQLRSDSSQPPVEDTCYTRTRSMLPNLGLQNYESNFKKNLLTDRTMPLLKESDLV